jgi:uncharacterized protein (TIGR03067 family)
MKSIAWLMLAVGSLLLADEPKQEAGRKDLEKMQGDWALVSLTRDGMKFPDEEAQALFRTVKGNRFTVARYEKEVGKGTFSIDATKKPHTIDFVPDTAKDKSQAMLGIYKWGGEKLVICYAPPGKARPTEFTSKEGQMQTLAVWEREAKKRP